MTINTKIRLTILASAFALAAAAPAAFADSGVWYRSMQTKPAGTSVAPAAVRGEQPMNKKIASDGVAPFTGTWYQGIHTDAGGTPDAPAARHTEAVMNKVIVASRVAPDTGTWYQAIHTDPGGTPDAPAARHSEQVMNMTIVSGDTASVAFEQRGLPKY